MRKGKDGKLLPKNMDQKGDYFYHVYTKKEVKDGKTKYVRGSFALKKNSGTFLNYMPPICRGFAESDIKMICKARKYLI